jgi:hypothetical protein
MIMYKTNWENMWCCVKVVKYELFMYKWQKYVLALGMGNFTVVICTVKYICYTGISFKI